MGWNSKKGGVLLGLTLFPMSSTSQHWIGNMGYLTQTPIVQFSARQGPLNYWSEPRDTPFLF